MKAFWFAVQLAFAGVTNWITWFWGENDDLLIILLTFVIINYISHIMCAIIDKQLSTNIEINTTFQKMLIFALVGIGHVLDKQIIGSVSVMCQFESVPTSKREKMYLQKVNLEIRFQNARKPAYSAGFRVMHLFYA